jgi:hypothetical protein
MYVDLSIGFCLGEAAAEFRREGGQSLVLVLHRGVRLPYLLNVNENVNPYIYTYIHTYISYLPYMKM